MQALVVLAREPTPGRVKSRLAKDLSPERAAALYRAFILDTLEMCSRVTTAAGWIAHTPDGAGDVFDALGGAAFRLIPQGEGDLGERLGRVFRRLFGEGYERVVVLGSDAPTLPDRIVTQAFRSLEGRDVAIGPCSDGGYYLLGLSRPFPEILRGIPWGTDRVLARTLERVESEGRTLAMLPPWYDVDTISELALLKAQLEGWRLSGEETLPRHTFALLFGMHPT